jgi:hypothetical protein
LAHAAAGDPRRAAAYFEEALGETDEDTRSELVNESAAVLRALAQTPGADQAALARLIDLVERRA